MANPRPLPARPRPFEQIFEDVGKTFSSERNLGAALAAGSGLPARLLVGLGLLPVGSILIVFLSFVRIAQDLVRRVQLLELLLHLGLLGPAMEIGMDLAREAAIGLLDVIRRGRLGETENLVVVAFCGSHSKGISPNV